MTLGMKSVSLQKQSMSAMSVHTVLSNHEAKQLGTTSGQPDEDISVVRGMDMASEAMLEVLLADAIEEAAAPSPFTALAEDAVTSLAYEEREAEAELNISLLYEETDEEAWAELIPWPRYRSRETEAPETAGTERLLAGATLPVTWLAKDETEADAELSTPLAKEARLLEAELATADEELAIEALEVTEDAAEDVDDELEHAKLMP